jgi:hypothetical protein
MTQSTDWVRAKLRRHNRLLHGWGIVCGCAVKPPALGEKPWLVHICPGYILTPQGDEILISAEAQFDLADCFLQSGDPCAFARPCPPLTRASTGSAQIVYLTVSYLECDVRPVRVAPVGCSCGDAQCENSRTREAYEFCCTDTKPPAPNVPPWGCEHLCKGDVLDCPDCPQSGAVVLATITLPATIDSALTISYADRQLLYSAAMLREMAICACPAVVRPTPAQPVPAPPTVPTPTDPPVITVVDPHGWPSPYQNDVSVDIKDATAGAVIKYTIGLQPGTNPGANSKTFTTPFPVKYNGGKIYVVKAQATAPGHTPSAIVQANVEFANPIQ